MQENLDKDSYTNYFNLGNQLVKPNSGFSHLHIAFSIIGTMIWFFGYALFSFYKDYLITSIRKDEKFGRGFYYKYVNYQSYKKLIFGFNVFYIFFVMTLLLFINMRYFCILSGLVIFVICYFGFCIKFYIVENNKFDLFDELIWFYQAFIKEKLNKLRNKNEITDGAKQKKE